MKNTIKLLMCAVMALCFAGCTPEEETPSTALNFNVSVIDNSIAVTWNAESGAVYYEIQLDDNDAVRTDKTAHRFDKLMYDTTYTVSLKALNASGTVLKEGTKSATIGSRAIPAFREWVSEIPATTISDNGRWAAGCFDINGIIINLVTDEVTLTPSVALYDIDDNGVGVGSYHGQSMDGVAAMYINGQVYEIDLSSITATNYMSCLTSITPDGSYAVGWYASVGEDLNGDIYGDYVPFCYDVVKNKVTVPEPGQRLYNDGAMSLHSVAPDRSILGCDQVNTGDGINLMLNTVWEDEYTPYQYVHFEYDAAYMPVSTMGDMNNRFSTSGRYVYGYAVTDYTSTNPDSQPAVYDRETQQMYTYGGIGAVTSITEDGIVFINDAPYGNGSTTYVTTIDNGMSATFQTLEAWLLEEHGIDVSIYVPGSNTDPENALNLDGVMTLGVSADGRTLMCITSSYSGWVTTVIYLDGVKE